MVLARPGLLTPKSLWSNNPIPGDTELYLPLWSPGLNGNAFRSADPFHFGIANTGAIQVDNGRLFDGLDDFIDLGDDRFDALSAGTVLVWVNFVAAGAQRFFGFDVDASNRAFLTKSGTNKLSSNMRTGATQRLSFTGDTTLNTDTWYLLGFGNDTNGNRLSVNGVAETGSYSAGNAATDFFFDNMATGTTLYSLGRAMVSGGSFDFGNCTIGEYWIFNRKLAVAVELFIFNRTRGRYQ